MPFLVREHSLRLPLNDLNELLCLFFFSAPTGDMVRLMLIQVQSVKVDVAFALSSLDKLLKSNELNFAFLSVIPSGFVVAAVYYQVASFFPNRGKRNRRQLYESIRFHLRSSSRFFFFFFLPRNPSVPLSHLLFLFACLLSCIEPTQNDSCSAQPL